MPKDKRPLKILQFIETGGPGGAERVVLSLSEALANEDIEVAVLTLREGWFTECLDRAGIKRFLIESKRSLDISLPFRISKLLKDEDFNFLHSHLLDSNFYGALAASLAGVDHLATEHGDIHHLSAKRFMRSKLAILSLLKTRFCAVSQFTAQRLGKFGIPRRRICVIGNPVSSPSSIDSQTRKATRKELGIFEEPPGHWLWVHVASLRPVKDQITLLEGFKQTITELPYKQSLAIVGDGPERAKLEALADKLGISENIRFIGFKDNVWPYLFAADGFILSSRSEAMPVAILEAALAELIVISSDAGGVSELVEHGETGYLFLPGNVEGLSHCMRKVLVHQDEGQRRAEKLKRFVASNYSVDAVIDDYLSIY